MESKSMIREILSPYGTINLVVGDTTKAFANFIEKVSVLFKEKKRTTNQINEMSCTEVLYEEYFPCLFVHCASLQKFLSQVVSNEEIHSILKKIKVTYLLPPSNYEDIERFSEPIMGVKKKKYTYTIPLVQIDLCSLKKKEMEIYLKKTIKVQYFKIQKMLRKRRPNNSGKKLKIPLIKHEIEPNSLISISKEVKAFIKRKIITNSKEVIAHIVSLLRNNQSQKKKLIGLAHRNIQRRVYDVINVLSSLGIIYKEENPNRLEYRERNYTEETITQKTEKLKENLAKKEDTLQKLVSKISLSKYIIKNNANKYNTIIYRNQYVYGLDNNLQVNANTKKSIEEDYNNNIQNYITNNCYQYLLSKGLCPMIRENNDYDDNNNNNFDNNFDYDYDIEKIYDDDDDNLKQNSFRNFGTNFPPNLTPFNLEDNEMNCPTNFQSSPYLY